MAGISSLAAFFGYGGKTPPAPKAPALEAAPDVNALAAAQEAALSARKKKATIPGASTSTDLAGTAAPATTASKTLLGL